MQDPAHIALRPFAGPAQSSRPLRLGVLSNRLSTRNRRGIGRIRDVLGSHRDIPHVELEDWARLPDAVATLLEQEVDLLAVNGGDGTLVGLVTELRRRAEARSPALAVLASGNTNLVAGDVGPTGAPDRALARLIAASARGSGLECVERRIIRIEQEGAASRYGFFLGGMAVVRAIMMTRRTFHSLGVNHGPSNAAGIALSAFRVLLGGSKGDGLLAPVPAEIGYNGEAARAENCSVLLATTLDRLLFGAHPFRDDGPGPIRTLLVRGPVERPLRSLLTLLRGRPNARMAREGYSSRNAERLSLAFDGPIAIDGELHQVSRERPIVLSDGGPVRFLRC